MDENDYSMSPEEAARIAAHLAPRIEEYEAARGNDIVIPAGLSRADRRDFLANSAPGVLFFTEMSDAEIDDYIDDPEGRGKHHVCITGLSDDHLRGVLLGR